MAKVAALWPRTGNTQGSRRMPRRDDLRHRRHPTLAQTGTANDQVGHQSEQAVINIGCFGARPHRASPWDTSPCRKSHEESLISYCFLMKYCEAVNTCLAPSVTLGAQSRTRTGTTFRSADFKSAASTNSATRARRQEKWRLGSESNRRGRLCRPQHNHSAT